MHGDDWLATFIRDVPDWPTPGVVFKDGPYEAVEGADAVVILTEWDQFRALDLDRVKLLLNQPVMVDLRNIYRPEDMRARGFRYSSIGRG